MRKLRAQSETEIELTRWFVYVCMITMVQGNEISIVANILDAPPQNNKQKNVQIKVEYICFSK